MDSSQRSQGQLIAAGGGFLLFIFLFLPWFGTPEVAGLGGSATTQSGWEGQSSTDIYLFITAVVAIATAVTARGQVSLPGTTMNGATFLLGTVASILMLWLSFFDFPGGEDRKIGVYLSLLACLAIAYGAYRAVQEEAGGPAPRRRRERREPRVPREPREPRAAAPEPEPFDAEGDPYDTGSGPFDAER